MLNGQMERNLPENQPTSNAFNGNVSFVNFNQDFSSLAVATNTGYRLFSVNSIDKIEQIYQVEIGSVLIVERLFSSSLVTIVTEALPRRLQVCHFKKGTRVCEYDYTNAIVAVRLNRTRLVVCLEESLYIHDIRNMKLIHTIRDTPANRRGICALSTKDGGCYLAYPGSSAVGEVQVFDAFNLQAKMMLPAHDSPVAAVVFSPSGNQVATASEKGTVIRVFCVNTGSKVFELRRGLKRCVQISSMGFSPDCQFLCVSSNTETIHVFKLSDSANPSTPTNVRQEEAGAGWMDYLSKAVSASAGYLPAQVSDVLTQGRAFATVHMPYCGQRSVCGLVMIKMKLRLLVASSDGYLYIYDVSTSEGGDCVLLKQYKLDGDLSATECGPGGAGGCNMTGSYAGALRGRSTDPISGSHDSERYQEMLVATEVPPPPGPYKLSDDDDFPPMMST